MREAEKEHQKLRDQIQKAELKLEEQKKVLSTTYKLMENDDSALLSPKDNVKEVTETPKAAKKKYVKSNITNSMPRFMTSTVASRQRQSISEREIVGKAISVRSAMTRGSLQFSGSQSMNFSDLRLKAVIQSSTGKSRLGGETTESPKCNGLESKPASNPGSRMLTSSDPNVVVPLRRHRRRMSDLI